MRAPNHIQPAARRLTVRVWVVLGALAVTLASVSIPINTVVYGIPAAVSIFIGLLQSGMIPLVAVRPRLALSLSLIPLALLPALSLDSVVAPWPVAVTTLITQVMVIVVIAFVSTWRVAIVSWLTSTAIVIAVIGMTPGRFDRFDASLASSIPFAAISAGLLAIALLLAQRYRIRLQLQRERQVTAREQRRREVMEERNRIARELHDVVAHGMSVIQVQASSAKYRLTDLDPAVAAEFDDIGATARNALAEMRQLLGVLRNEKSTTALGPQPGLFDIPALIDSSKSSAVAISLEWSVRGTDAPPSAVALAAYRIVQEALSNAVRHAPGAATRVTVSRNALAVDISVENDRSKKGSELTGSDAGSGGHGLVGMRERVLLVGGTLEHGPTEVGGFSVKAHLPIPTSVVDQP